MTATPIEVSAREAMGLLESGEAFPMDVREEFEVASGTLPGAVTIPMGQLPARWTELDPTRRYLVYCAHGLRSYQAVVFLRQQGVSSALSISGGISRWKAEGGAVEALRAPWA